MATLPDSGIKVTGFEQAFCRITDIPQGAGNQIENLKIQRT
jgi:hypothetical protein